MTRLFAGSKVRHGTQSGWSKHLDMGEDPCPACHAAKSKYDKSRRDASSDLKRRNRLFATAQHRAKTRLTYLYPDVYHELYLEEKAKLELGGHTRRAKKL
jgi:hypothetical protein